MKKAIAKFIILVVFSGICSVIWWNLWLYKGFWGASEVLVDIIGADGEGAYDVMMLEMFGWCVLLVGISIYVIVPWLSRKCKKDSSVK